MRIEGERGRSSQNEHTVKREGRGGRGVVEIEHGWTRWGGGWGLKLGNLERTYFLNVP